MARYPAATWNPAGTTPGGLIVPRVVIFHVTAGEGNARPHSGLEWHFEVSYSGAVEQQVDTSRRADANNKANGFAISIETEGLGPGEWTDAQLDSLVDLSEWCIAQPEHDIARQITPTWDGTGFGYHVMFGAPGPWTPVAKSCPGPRRIKQFHDVLMPRILNPYQEDDMPTAAEVADAVWGKVLDLSNGEKQPMWAVQRFIQQDAHNAAVGCAQILANQDPAKFAELLAAELEGVTVEQMEQAVRNVFADAAED